MSCTDDVMRRSFCDAAMTRLEESTRVRHEQLLVGFEAEVSVVRRSDLEVVSQEVRDAIIEDLGGDGGVELGAHQLELRTPPLDVREVGLFGLCAALRDRERIARRAAAARGATILRCGFCPFPVDLTQIVHTDAPRYHKVPAYHDSHRGRFVNTRVGRLDPLEIGYADVIALANSVQFNVQAPDPAGAIELTNRLLSASPALSAIAGNARFLGGRDLGVADGRMLVWQQSHDTRDIIEFLADAPTRVGLPADYYSTLADYMDRVASFAFIFDDANAAFQIGVGLYWNDVRIKFPDDRIVVEFRPLSVQPTAIEDVALFALALGLAAIPDSVLPLRPMRLLGQDRDAALQRGLDAELHAWNGETWVLAPAKKVVAEAIDLARRGLKSIGLQDDVDTFLAVLERRLIQGTPSDRLAREVDELTAEGLDVPEALRTLLKHRCFISDEE